MCRCVAMPRISGEFKTAGEFNMGDVLLCDIRVRIRCAIDRMYVLMGRLRFQSGSRYWLEILGRF